MDQSEKVITRGWLLTMIGAALLVGGLIALCFPVVLNSYDHWGIQVTCGNGYHSELLQAGIDDQGQDQHSAPVGTSESVRPATNYVEQCQSALAHRRAVLGTVAGLGALILTIELVAWARGDAPEITAERTATPHAAASRTPVSADRAR